MTTTHQLLTIPAQPAMTTARPTAPAIYRALTKRSFATLATTSDRGHPHSAGVLYAAVGTDLWVSTMRASRKARNIAHNDRVAVTVPVRRIPFGPPSSIHFQGRARIIDLDDPELRRLASNGSLKSITGHGELELEGGCFLKITPKDRLLTYGLGLSLLQLIRDPLNAGASVTVTEIQNCF